MARAAPPVRLVTDLKDARVQIEVLGSSAGGGFPQWNCNCRNCRAVRAGEAGFAPRTQSSLAVSANGVDWLLLNASPDLRQQIAASPALNPAPGAPPRSSPIKAAALTNADVDHIAGLLTLRERQPFDIYGAARVLETLEANPIFKVCAPDVAPRRALPLDAATPIHGGGVDLGLSVESFLVPGKTALYLEDADAKDFGSRPGDTIGLKVTETKTGRGFFHIPGCARIDAALAARLDGADLVFFDGTLWSDDEMLAQGLMPKTGARMGHMNMNGEDGSIRAFEALRVRRKVFIHINNSNPVLDAASPERAAARAAGWIVAEDGMRFTA